MTSNRKIALVTGSNKGIGNHIAGQLAQEGVHVYLAARDLGRGSAAAKILADEGLDIEFIQLDVTDRASVCAAAERVGRNHGRLDILVSNAAITSGLDPTSAVSVDDLTRTFNTNVFGITTVTNTFLPLLRKSSSPRIVNVSSAGGSMTFMADPEFVLADLNNAAYQSSKAALNALTVLYAKEFRPDGIKVNAVCPGYRATELNGGLPTPGAGDPAEGAGIAVTMALIGDDGPTAEFRGHDGTLYPW